MKVTIAIDDIQLPLPPMATPDIRQTMLEIVLDMLAGHGVDDVHIIIANSLHRKMTAWEMKRMVGHEDLMTNTILTATTTTTPSGKTAMIMLGHTRHNEPLSLNRRAIESDLLIYVNINLVPMDGGHKSVAVGLCDYESLRAHHDPQTIRDSDSYMDPARSELANKGNRLGKIVDKELNVFHIETAINNRMYGSDMDFLLKNEDDFTAFDRMKCEAMRYTMSKLPRPARRKLLHSRPAQYEMIACYAGKTEPVHAKDRREGLPAVRDSGPRSVRHPDHRHSGHLAVQRLFDSESAAGAGDGPRLSLQFLSQQAVAQERRRDDHSSSVF